MENQNTKSEFQEYLRKGLEIINNNDSEYKSLLDEINTQLNSGKDDVQVKEVIAPVFLALLQDKILYKDELQKVTNSYDEVLGLITHEFKNILTSIHGYNMLLEKRLIDDKDKESVQYLTDSDRLTRQLFDMTDSLLKMSLGEKGLIKPELKLIEFSQDLYEPLKRDLETELNNKNMRIKFRKLTKNLVIEGDEGLLDIVLRNLLLNAIKYGKQSSEISVQVNRNKNNFSVAIKNYCDDIPADLCEGIFEKFKSRKVGTENGGTGIGLYNVKNIVNLHQGTITCKCLAKKWIEFQINIPQSA